MSPVVSWPSSTTASRSAGRPRRRTAPPSSMSVPAPSCSASLPTAGAPPSPHTKLLARSAIRTLSRPARVDVLLPFNQSPALPARAGLAILDLFHLSQCPPNLVFFYWCPNFFLFSFGFLRPDPSTAQAKRGAMEHDLRRGQPQSSPGLHSANSISSAFLGPGFHTCAGAHRMGLCKTKHRHRVGRTVLSYNVRLPRTTECMYTGYIQTHAETDSTFHFGLRRSNTNPTHLIANSRSGQRETVPSPTPLRPPPLIPLMLVGHFPAARHDY